MTAGHYVDPRHTIQHGAMSAYQWSAVAVTVALCALDGFDVQAISFAAPGIVHQWHITKAALGLALSAGLLGMAAGSLAVAPVADLIGRRALVLIALGLTIVGMGFSSATPNLTQLALWRIFTGLGIGATIATINPLAAEYANLKRRDFAVSLMAGGFPMGGVLGGWAAAALMAHGDWRSVFGVGAVVGAVLIPVVLWRLPEPIAFLMARPNARGLERVNVFLVRCGHPRVEGLHVGAQHSRRPTDIFQPGKLGRTLQITSVYFLLVITIFFYFSWTPQLIADLGLPASTAAAVAATANLAGVASGLMLGWSTPRFGLKPLTTIALAGMGLATMAFAFAPADATLLKAVAAITGFFLFSGMVGLYAVIARTFPTHARATGSGFVIGVGRVGSVLAPALAGWLFAAGLSRGTVVVMLGAPALLASLILLAFPVRPSGTADSVSE